jgi:wax ester synthase-like acyl-CoA acyltransferase family protein
VLQWDRAGWSGNIGALAILDGTTLLDNDSRVRIEAVRRHIESRLHVVPRFQQRLYRPPPGLGWPLWVDAESFSLADHVAVFQLAARRRGAATDGLRGVEPATAGTVTTAVGSYGCCRVFPTAA